MPRKAREKSESGIYHIIMRGINRQTIFEDEEDCIQFMQALKKYKEISGYRVYAYCLMGNHVHLLLAIGLEPLEQVMRRLCGSYVYWYNNKYQRIGNLFQDRFKSEPVKDDQYFQTVLRYIHQNPVKAGLVQAGEEYRWSSFGEYISQGDIVDRKYALEMISNDKEKAIRIFVDYSNEMNDNICLDIDNEPKARITDEEARSIIEKECGIRNAKDLQGFDVITRNKYLRQLKGQYNLSIRQIERLTGINRGVILKC